MSGLYAKLAAWLIACVHDRRTIRQRRDEVGLEAAAVADQDPRPEAGRSHGAVCPGNHPVVPGGCNAERIAAPRGDSVPHSRRGGPADDGRLRPGQQHRAEQPRLRPMGPGGNLLGTGRSRRIARRRWTRPPEPRGFPAEGGAGLRVPTCGYWRHAAVRNADAGRIAAASRYPRRDRRSTRRVLQRSEAKDSAVPDFADALKLRAEAWIASVAGDARSALATAAERDDHPDRKNSAPRLGGRN